MYTKTCLISSEPSADVLHKLRRLEGENKLKELSVCDLIEGAYEKRVFSLYRPQKNCMKQHSFVTKLRADYVMEMFAAVNLEPCSFACPV